MIPRDREAPGTAWLVFIQPDEAGVLPDDAADVYRFDDHVQNAKKVLEGDILVLRNPDMIGTARVVRLVSGQGKRERLRCPTCDKAKVRCRSTMTPPYACECGAVFDNPVRESLAVTTFAAHFDGTFISDPRSIPRSVLKAACPRFSLPVRIQRIDLDRLRALLSAENLPISRSIMKAPTGNWRPRRRTTKAEVFERDPAVVEWVLLNAAGICELCGEPARFSKECGSPYLEVHHVQRLADGGPDIVHNAVALHADCHRRLHLGAERIELIAELRSRIPRLLGPRVNVS